MAVVSRWGVVVGLAALLLALAWVLAPLPGTLLVVSDELRPADAILVTYAAMTSAGVDEAARLFRAGYAARLVLSDFKVDVAGVPETRAQPLARRALLERGVPVDAIVTVDALPNAEAEEAVEFRDLIARQGWHSVIAVTTEFRARRTVSSLRGATRRDGVDVLVHPYPTAQLVADRWWSTHDSISTVLNEWPRVAYYAVLGRF